MMCVLYIKEKDDVVWNSVSCENVIKDSSSCIKLLGQEGVY